MYKGLPEKIDFVDAFRGSLQVFQWKDQKSNNLNYFKI